MLGQVGRVIVSVTLVGLLWPSAPSSSKVIPYRVAQGTVPRPLTQVGGGGGVRDSLIWLMVNKSSPWHAWLLYSHSSSTVVAVAVVHSSS